MTKKIIVYVFLSIFIGSMVFVGLASAAMFPDTVGHPYRDAIESVKTKGIVDGYPDGSFKPENTINRAELTKIIVETVYPGVAAGSNCFPDVTDQWFAKYVCFAKDKGIISGYPDGTFKPGNNVNWVESLKITLEAFEMPIRDNKANWYQKYVNFADSGELNPPDIGGNDVLLKRGQMADFIYRTLELKKRIDSTLEALAKMKAQNDDVSRGPCLGIIDSDWVGDVAHMPRNADDNVPSNQCEDFKMGDARHYLEVTPDGKFIKVGHAEEE